MVAVPPGNQARPEGKDIVAWCSRGAALCVASPQCPVWQIQEPWGSSSRPVPWLQLWPPSGDGGAQPGCSNTSQCSLSFQQSCSLQKLVMALCV